MNRLIQSGSIQIVSEEAARQRPVAPASVTDGLKESLVNEEGQPVSVEEAIATYLKFNKSKMNEPDNISRAEYARHNQYPRILEGDRRFQDEYGLTTVTFTRRVCPLDESGAMFTPWELDEQLHVGGVHDAVRSAIDYQLGDREYEYVGVTTPRELNGAPQEHLHYWIDDPADEVTPSFFETARERHLEYVPNARPEDHQIRVDGTDGTVRVSTDPETVDHIPEETATIITHSDYPAMHPTRSAHFVATRLPDLVVWDYYNHDEDNPPDTLLEGAAAGWAVPHQWFRTSSGMPPADIFPPDGPP